MMGDDVWGLREGPVVPLPIQKGIATKQYLQRKQRGTSGALNAPENAQPV